MRFRFRTKKSLVLTFGSVILITALVANNKTRNNLWLLLIGEQQVISQISGYYDSASQSISEIFLELIHTNYTSTSAGAGKSVLEASGFFIDKHQSSNPSYSGLEG